MADINSYANNLLVDFTDAMHAEITRVLVDSFGDNWLSQGVRRHFREDQFSRVEQMITNPMRVIEMNKSSEDIHGLEHFWNIINGNWRLFQRYFQDKTRTKIYLDEITELRHNLAHRRAHHVLLKSDLIRIVGNCAKCLSAMESPNFEKFAEIVDSLTSGGIPWGSVLEGRLPPSDDLYAEFVERPIEQKCLSTWLDSGRPQILVWGYGGAGKSALTYRFARDVRDSANTSLSAVCWVSAKSSEYVEGATRIRSADFYEKERLIRTIWSMLYDADDVPATLGPKDLIKELTTLPILLIVDDFDTVSDDEDLSEFLLYDLRNTSARVVFTSRHRVQGMRHLEIGPFTDDELAEFVKLRSLEYGANRTQCVKRLPGIKSVTSGYPLFVDDLIHHAAIIGVDRAMSDWSQRRGDAAREYALRRQIEHLGRSCGDVLIALSVANRSLFPAEISSIAGLTDEDAIGGLHELLRWRIVNREIGDAGTPLYKMNANTNRLVQQTYRDDNRFRTYSAAFRALIGERVPEMKTRAIGRIISRTHVLVRTDSIDSARAHLEESMVGELKESDQLYGVLGWLHSKQGSAESQDLARAAFGRAHELGSRKIDTYFHWMIMEKNSVEAKTRDCNLISNSDVHIFEELAAKWRECERICEIGVERCGSSRLLCYWAGYAACREAKAQERTGKYAYSQGAFSRSIDWYKKSLSSHTSDISPVKSGSVWRGLTLAFDGLGNEQELRDTLLEWYAVSGSDPYFDAECGRMIRKYQGLQEVPEFRYLLVLPATF